MEIIFASANKNKISEVSAMFPPNIRLLGIKDIGINEDIPEPGTTIKENSFLKAQYVVERLKQLNLQMPVFADDSGLEAEALNKAPGVYSARYAGFPKNDLANNQKLLLELKSHTDRRARFVTIITYIENGKVNYFEGEIKGTIAYEPRGTGGFGYDPLFIPQGYRSTFSELSVDIKNTISHRALAVKNLLRFISAI